MLAQLLERRGLEVREIDFAQLQTAKLRELDLSDTAFVALSYMNADSLAHARFLVRRLRRRLPDATIVVGFWTFPPEDAEKRDPTTATGADRVATTLGEAVESIVKASSAKASQDRAVPGRDAAAELVT
jgi:hypothetical protein